MAAVLACGEPAWLSHMAAAALWDAAEWPDMLEVTAPSRRSRPGLITHRSCTLTPRDIRRRHGVPVTSPVRTALDLQRRLADPRLIRLVNDLRSLGHLTNSGYTELCERFSATPGSPNPSSRTCLRGSWPATGCRCRRSTCGS